MKNANDDNGQPSATPPPTTSGRATDDRAAPLSDLPTEDAVLRAQAAAAHEAISATLSRLKGNLKEAADVRVWTQRHPWIALGAAATAGVAAAGVVKGARKSDRATGGPPTDATAEASPEAPRAKHAGQDRSMFDKLFGGLFDLAATSLQHWLVGMLQARFVSEAAGDAAKEGTQEAARERTQAAAQKGTHAAGTDTAREADDDPSSRDPSNHAERPHAFH